MASRARWIAALAALGAGALCWRALAERPEERPATRPTPPVRAPDARAGAAPETRDELVSPREPPAPRDEPRDERVPEHVEATDARSPLAQELDDVAASYLTDDPRVAELLDLVGDMAARAVVEPESVQVERDEEGGLRFVRGALTVGELRGTFLIDDGVYHVQFPAAVAEAPWAQRDVLVTFQPGAEHASGCHATVQYRPQTELPASRHLAPGEEKLVGWSVGVSPEAGAIARPMTVGAAGDEWQIGSGADAKERELPWVSNTSSFDAWLRLLEPYAAP